MSVLYVRDESGKLVPIYTIKGEDGKTPYIQDGYWYIDGKNTGVKAGGTGVDKVTSVDTAWWGTDTPYAEETGIGWSDGFAFLDTNGQVISRGGIHQRVPIAPGENVTFTVDEGNQVVKINATGGGSSTPSVSLIGTWTVIDNPEIPTSDIPLEFTSNGFEFTKITTGTAGPDFWGIKNLKYSGDKAEIGAYVNNPSGSNGITHGWIDEAYRYITVTKEPDDPEAIAWLGNNTDAPKVKLEKEQMPQIRFANFQDTQGTMRLYEGNPFTFTVEIVGGGELKEGDLLQICVRRKYWNKIKDTEEDFKHKWKLRKVLQREITAEDIGKRFLSINVTLADVTSKGKWMFRNDRKTSNVDTHSYMYFRIKRVTKLSDTTGEECDAIFSNVEKVAKTYEYSINKLTIK